MAVNECLHAMLDKAWENKSLDEIMKAPPSALAGVSDKQAEVLKDVFRITTIEQLANSRTFAAAQTLQNLARLSG
jgi:hypothetical protein